MKKKTLGLIIEIVVALILWWTIFGITVSATSVMFFVIIIIISVFSFWQLQKKLYWIGIILMTLIILWSLFIVLTPPPGY
jgi:hypothetical protein